MQSRNRLRLAGYRAPLAVVFGVFAFSGCGDVNAPPARAADDWAEAAVVSAKLESQITVLSNGKPVQTRSVFQRADLPVLHGLSAKQFMMAGDAPGNNGPRTVVKHFRDRTGLVHSIGIRFDGPGKPPSRFYLFENGHIRSVVNPTYVRHGLGYVRSKARVTYFGADGSPSSQVELRASEIRPKIGLSDASSLRFAIPKGISDALSVFLPRELHAEETDAGCATEWAAYATAAFALASYTLALAALVESCINGVAESCLLIEQAAIKFGGAMTAALLALDKLAACLEMQKRSTNDSELTGRDEGGDYDQRRDPVDFDRLKRVVEQFIMDSVSAGEYWCSLGGDYCIFY